MSTFYSFLLSKCLLSYIIKLWIQVTIPFKFINVIDYQVRPINNSESDDNRVILNKTQIEMIKIMMDNPNVNTNQLMYKMYLGHTAIQNNLTKLQSVGAIKRIGSKKKGYWEVIEHN